MADNGFRCGEYFAALEQFVSADDFLCLRKALGPAGGDGPFPGELERVRIFMEKHGPFYHPARLEVQARGRTDCFVVNVALSKAGRRVIQGEYRCLKQLRESFGEPYVPRAYDYGEVAIGKGRTASMFVGEWLAGYHEFHVTATPDGGQAVAVWDTENGRRCLSNDQARDVYRLASRILTYYYELATGRQIFPWHHAAGDFVLRITGGDVHVRLVTVRQYASMLESAGTDSVMMLNGLLLFFLNLSIRMRLDRLDGIGDSVWIGEYILPGIVNGFLEGLDTKPAPMGGISTSIHQSWTGYFHSFSSGELLELFHFILDTYPAESPELPIIRQNLKQHAEGLRAAMSHWRS
ncbi:MAG: hypothetical protein ACOZF0_08510 [Thermodesulfobacteriota bacterium]